MILLSFCIPALGQDNTKTFIYTKTKQADLEIVIHFPPGWKESDKRPGIVFFFGGGWENGTIPRWTSTLRAPARASRRWTLSDRSR